MKRPTIRSLTCLALTAFCLIVAALFVGCQSTPYAWENTFYDIKTNVTPIVIVQTNQVFKTNVVEKTEVQTNWVAGIPNVSLLPVRESTITSDVVVTLKTNYQVDYTYTENTNSAAVGRTAGSVANLILPGSGGLVTTAIAGLAALWGGLRSRKLKKTAAVLAQGIEVYGEVTKATGAAGAKLDGTVKSWLQQHQAETGVLTEVLDVIDQSVDNSDAKTAADAIRKFVS
jgi:hypothetical protein